MSSDAWSSLILPVQTALFPLFLVSPRYFSVPIASPDWSVLSPPRFEDDVGGTRLERAGLSAELEAQPASRWVQIRGLPGSGKSVLLRRRAEDDFARGPVLFLKSDRLEGTGWGSFATANGISNPSLSDLLVELAATGSSTLYIDGIVIEEKIPVTVTNSALKPHL
jgi:hypothetical protein